MKVVTTNLTIRFYRKDGWTLDVLESLVVERGLSLAEPFSFFDDVLVSRTGQHGMDFSYWVLKPGPSLDMPKLLKIVTSVERTFNDNPEKTDAEHLESFNW